MERESIRGRLNQLAEAHSQAELARRTGVAPPAVHRYLHGAKVPSEFCAALVREFGVNPAWLLTGEGATYLSDVSAGTQRMAGDLLALVGAMNQVARMRLGSLAGKQHLKVLRELNEAVGEYERLREKMDEHTTPFFGRVLEDYRVTVMIKKDLNRAGALRPAVEQLGRMNNHPLLRRRMLAFLAFHDYLAGRTERSVEFQRQLFRLELGRDTEYLPEDAFTGRNFALVLFSNGLQDEAAMVAQVTRSQCELAGNLATHVHALAMLEQVIDVERGQLEGRVSRALAAFARMAASDQALLTGGLLRVLLLTGAIGLKGAPQVGVAGRGRAQQIARFANWHGDAESLEFAQASAPGDSATALPPDDPLLEELTTRLKALQGSKAPLRKLAEQWRQEARRPGGFKGPFDAAVAATRAALALKDSKAAAADFAFAEKLRISLPPRCRPDLLKLSEHYRNALDLNAASALHSKAKLFFQDYAARGYGLFAPWA